MTVLLALAGCSPPGDDAAESELRIAGYVNAMTNPFDGAHTFFLTGQAIYDSLVRIEGEGGVPPEPMLAKAWEVADDGLTISFTLRDDVDFQDGVHMNAEGVAKYLTYLFDLDTFPWKVHLVDQVGASVEATGEYTFDIHFTKQPVIYQWLELLGITAIASPALVDDPTLAESGALFGSGPYTIETADSDVSITYVRDPDHWNTEMYPYDRVTVQSTFEPISVLNAVKSGQLDAGEINIQLAGAAEEAGLAVHEGPGRPGHLYIADHDGELVPALRDVRVREAIARAFDREAILESVNLGYGTADSALFHPDAPEYQGDQPDPYPYDPELALQLLAEAGYPDGFDLTISYVEGEGLGQGSNLAPLVQSALGDIGINVTYVTTPSAGAADWVVNDTSQNATPVYMQNNAWTNFIGNFEDGLWGPHGSPAFAALLSQKQLAAPSEQPAAFAAIGKFLTDEIWYVTFSKPSSAFVSIPGIEIELAGLYPNPKIWQYRPTD
jgi:peptide/nickel transport system substrate-binding protein